MEILLQKYSDFFLMSSVYQTNQFSCDLSILITMFSPMRCVQLLPFYLRFYYYHWVKTSEVDY